MTKPEKFDPVPAPRRKPAVTVDESTAPTKSLAEQVADANGTTAALEQAAQAEAFMRREATETPTEVLHVRTEDVRPSALNPRVEVDAGLVASVEQLGIITPLTVRQLDEGGYEVISGHRRLAAAKKAELEYVPVVVLDAVDDVRWLELNLAEQINRRDLQPLEEAAAARKLVELAHYTPEQVGEKLGQSTSWVLKRLSLLKLASEVQRALKKGEVSLSVAQGLAVIPEHNSQVKALEQAKHRLSQKWDVESILGEVRNTVSRPLRDASWKLTDADLLPAAGACSACPHNSSNNRMPGLFETAKAAPSCANPGCYDEKRTAAWKRATAKLTDAGAKLLSLSKSEDLFRHSDTVQSEVYVAVDAPCGQDKSKRTWRQLMEKAKATPQVYVARDRKGQPVELYQRVAAMKVCAETLKLKWAANVEDEDVEPTTATTVKGYDAKAQELQLARDAREAVKKQVVAQVVRDIAAKGLTLADVRAAVLDEEGKFNDYDLEKYAELMGMDDAAEKAFRKSATLNQLISFLWSGAARFDVWLEMPPDLVQLAEAHGLNAEKMLEAQLATAKAEALMEKKP